jgi:hypothetical protein
MKAQDLFKEKGYSVADNRSIGWRNINKAMDYGIEIVLVSVGKIRTNKNGFNWKICLKYRLKDGRVFKSFYKAPNLDNFVCGKFQSTSSDVVSDQVLSIIINFRQKLINNGFFPTSVEFEKDKGMCKCDKCRGKGIIPAFMHVSKGVCFDCMGLGYGKQGKISM